MKGFELSEDEKSGVKRYKTRIAIGVVAVIVLIGVAVGVTLGIVLNRNEPPSPQPRPPTAAELLRVDCYPEAIGKIDTVTKEKCERRGCRYEPSVGYKVPSCFFDSSAPSGGGYRVGSQTRTELGYRFHLERNKPGSLPDEIKNVHLDVHELSENLLRIKFTDRDADRYEVPEEILKLDIPTASTRDFWTELRYEFKVITTDPLRFQVIRKDTGTVLWDMNPESLILADQFLSLSTKLPSRNVYGFGENSHKTFRHDLNFTTWGLFARDEVVTGTADKNHYGVHPFYTCLEDDGFSHGVLLLNSNAMDYSLTPAPMLTYRTVGGILDFYMFLGPTPENVVQQYTSAVGRPYMPPYWSLGFQLCRYGYRSLENLKAAVDRTLSYDIPLDVQYADIDHYDERKVFTVDNVTFNGLKEYFDKIRSMGIRTIIILDPCYITNETNYEPFERTKAVNGYIEWADRESMPDDDYDEIKSLSMLGYVWPKGKVVFPDFFNNDTKEIWRDLIVKHYDEKIKFDGLWLDMNEPANFGTNEDRPFNWPEDAKPYWSLKCPESKLDDPWYRTKASYEYDEGTSHSLNGLARLSDKSLCMTAKQGSRQYDHYDVHNLYGTSQIDITLRAMRECQPGERGLVFGRSTFPGSGKKAGHWLGDNESTWAQLRASVIGMLEFNLFGIPYVGADICGFLGDATPGLCKRWMQIGAFYPYSRNHNHEDAKDQDPGVYGPEVARMSREALHQRYWVLPYLYTLFHHANVRGNTVVRPVFHEFPNDEVARGLDYQFLWGDALLISPIIDEDGVPLRFYLPKGRWYEYSYEDKVVVSDGEWYTWDINPDTRIPLHMRGGRIIPMQVPANNTKHSRQNDFHLRVYLDDVDGNAQGDLYWDDGVSIDTFENGNYYYAVFQARRNRLTITVDTNNDSSIDDLYLDAVRVASVGQRPSVIIINGKQQHLGFEYNADLQRLDIKSLHVQINDSLEIEWSTGFLPSEEDMSKVNCMPDGAESKAECLKRKCFWSEFQGVHGVPRCYLDKATYGYTYSSETNVGDKKRIVLDRNPASGSMFGGDVNKIDLVIEYLDNDLLRVKFEDPAESRFEPPVDLDRSGDSAGESNSEFEVQYENTGSGLFYIIISRKSTGKIIWDTRIGGLTFADKFLQLATSVSSKNLYGFGETRHFNFKHDFRYETWPMFARDQGPGWSDYPNLYGVHPYYLCLENPNGQSHGVLLLNSNAQEVQMLPNPGVLYRTIGGVLDFYFILGDSPEDVTSRYTQLVGKPYLVPYWSLGFQLCRYGYDSLANLKAAVKRTRDANIPLDVQYADIDHMDERKTFTVDDVNFRGLQSYVKEIKEEGVKFIIILDPCFIANNTNYGPYDRGVTGDVFIRWPADTPHPDWERFNNTMMHGYVWPKGPTVFPDFLKSSGKDWWREEIKTWHKELTFDGLWIDMNEPANFGTNEDRPFNWPPEDKPYWSLKCPTSQLDDPPYKPKSVFGPRLSDKTLCMVGEQTDGTKTYSQYDTHSLYGWSQTEPTVDALKEATGRRSIVVTRSTFVTSGKHGGHWLGDNESKWSHLHDSIIGMLEFNLFGIPYIGADICGFQGDTTPEMCERWMQLGAFYPYARNHNAINQKDQDPAIFGRAIAESSRRAFETRYTLLPFLYTLFYHANTKGTTVVRSLVAEFYGDPRSHGIDRQFLWGPSLLISPVLEEGKTDVLAFIPSGRWFDYYTGKEITGAKYTTLEAPWDHIPLHVRGGHILPTQKPAKNTMHSRNNTFGLIVAPDVQEKAAGELFWDDGDVIDSVPAARFTFLEFSFDKNNVTMTTKINDFLIANVLDEIRVFGIRSAPMEITVLANGDSTVHQHYHYHPQHQVLFITKLSLAMGDTADATWSVIWTN